MSEVLPPCHCQTQHSCQRHWGRGCRRPGHCRWVNSSWGCHRWWDWLLRSWSGWVEEVASHPPFPPHFSSVCLPRRWQRQQAVLLWAWCVPRRWWWLCRWTFETPSLSSCRCCPRTCPPVDPPLQGVGSRRSAVFQSRWSCCDLPH